MESIVLLEKPMPRVPLPDWHGKVWELRQTCDTRRNDAANLRSEARILRNETDSKTSWQTYDNNARIADRLTELVKWEEDLKSQVEAIDREVSLLRDQKALTETEIEFLALSFTVVNQCLTQRDQRGGADLCTDEAELEIKHELKVLESLKRSLTAKCQAAWEMVNTLEEMRQKISQDLEDKAAAIEIDEHNLRLEATGAGLSYKPDPLRLPASMVSYECWEEHCRYLKLKGDNALRDAMKLRESMYVPRERARNDLKSQNDATNFSLRKRIYQTQRIKNELEWQRLSMVKDMERLHKEIDSLEKSLANKTRTLQLAETRSENRLYRAGAERCRDQASVGLEEEVVQLRNTKALLKDKLDASKALYNVLEEQLIVVDRELANKEHALLTDQRCLDLRDQLARGQPQPNQTDVNVAMNQLQHQIPPEH